VTGALREESQLISWNCGPFAPICKIVNAIFNFTVSFEDEDAILSVQDTKMPSYFVQARRLALSGDPNDKETLTGSLPKILMPEYKHENADGKEVDPFLSLTRSEAQLVEGNVVYNKEKPSKEVADGANESDSEFDPLSTEEPYYFVRDQIGDPTTANPERDNLPKAKFGEVAPLHDRYGLLRLALTMSPGEMDLPDPAKVNCPASSYDARVIDVLDPERNAYWSAVQTDVNETEDRSDDPDCGGDPGDSDADGICPAPDDLQGEATADLDLQTKVSLASKAWSNMAGTNGAFASIAPPESFFRTEDIGFDENAELGLAADPQPVLTAYSYSPRRGSPVAQTPKLRISSLGGVRGALTCLLNALTAHPAVADEDACEDWLRDRPSGDEFGWPTEHGWILQGPYGVYSHNKGEGIEAIDIFGVAMGDPVFATHNGTVVATGSTEAYGNYVDVQSEGYDVSFVSRYAHFSSVNASVGDDAYPGFILGGAGDTGMGDLHVHYEFRYRVIPMQPPYIPEAVTPGCVTRAECGNIAW